MFWLRKIAFPKGTWLFLFFALVISACSKTDFPELKDNQIGFDPATEKEEVNRILQVPNGTYWPEKPLPSKSGPITISSLTYRVSQPYIIHLWPPDSNRVDSIEIGNELNAFIPIKFTQVEYGQYFKPVNAYLKVSGASGHWKLPIQNDASNQSGSISLAVPALVREGDLKITICTELACVFPGYDTIRVFTDTVNALLVVRPPIPCGSIIKGKFGLSIRKFDFGEYKEPGKVKVRFQTGGIPDRLDVRYGGQYVVSTCSSKPDENSFPNCAGTDCWPITNESWKEFEFEYSPSKGRFAEFYILGSCTELRTIWFLDVSCPKK